MSRIVQFRRCPYCGAMILNDVTGNYHVFGCHKLGRRAPARCPFHLFFEARPIGQSRRMFAVRVGVVCGAMFWLLESAV